MCFLWVGFCLCICLVLGCCVLIGIGNIVGRYWWCWFCSSCGFFWFVCFGMLVIFGCCLFWVCLESYIVLWVCWVVYWCVFDILWVCLLGWYVVSDSVRCSCFIWICGCFCWDFSSGWWECCVWVCGNGVLVDWSYCCFMIWVVVCIFWLYGRMIGLVWFCCFVVCWVSVCENCCCCGICMKLLWFVVGDVVGNYCWFFCGVWWMYVWLLWYCWVLWVGFLDGECCWYWELFWC